MDRRVLVWDGGHDYVNYKAALSAVGLEAVVSADMEEAARCAALLLPGGGDIADRLPPEEERVIAAFTAAEKPILGICRGLQALNVFFGGTLCAYIPDHQSPEGDIVHATRAVGELAGLVGTILNTIGQQFHIEFLNAVIVTIGKGDGAVHYTIGGLCSAMVGPGMAVAIARALNAPPLVLFSLIPVGFATNYMGGAGGPLAVLFVAIVAAELGKAVSKETKIDILVTPIVTVLVGVGFAALIAAPVGRAASAVGQAIMWATELQPFFMGIIVSVVIGVALTLPISSAAICAALGLTGLAGGAAVAGCCAQMIGFAVMSFPENRWGGLAAQGLGTSMLQMGNIVRNPRVWIPPTLASAITGPVATCLFRLEMNGAPVSSGMGTCGLVGQIGVYTGWVSDVASGAKAAITGMDWLGLVLISFVLPAVLTWLIAIPLRKCGWIKGGDLKLDL